MRRECGNSFLGNINHISLRVWVRDRASLLGGNIETAVWRILAGGKFCKCQKLNMSKKLTFAILDICNNTQKNHAQKRRPKCGKQLCWMRIRMCEIVPKIARGSRINILPGNKIPKCPSGAREVL